MATYSADTAIAWAKSQLGSHAYDGYCQKFVATAYQKATGDYVSTGTATNAYRRFCKSTSRDNVPIGAAVYFNGSNAAVGHVGMYIGNGQYIHAAGRKGVIISNLSSARNYRGWGWQGNYVLTSSGSPSYVGNLSSGIGTNTTVLGSESGVEIFHAENPRTIRKWGLLRYFASVDTPSVGKDQAEKLLQLYNRTKRTLVVRDAFGDTGIRAGALIPTQLDIGDTTINNYMLVDKVVHKFKNDNHTMDLTLEGAWKD